MVRLDLTNDYCIISDKHNWILALKQGDRIFYESFFNNLEDCVQELLNRKIRLSNAQSIHSLIEYTKTLQTALNKALQPLKLEVKSNNG